MKVIISEVRLRTAFGGTDASLLALALGESVLSLPPADEAPSSLGKACSQMLLEPLQQLMALEKEQQKRPLMLGLASSAADPDHQQAKAVFRHLHASFPSAIDPSTSALFPFGRAAGLMALEAGLQRCRQTGAAVWVGAVHRRPPQAPGADVPTTCSTREAAVFLRLAPTDTPPENALLLSAAATELEATMDGSAQPTGLGRALHRLFEQRPVVVETLMPASAGDRHWLDDWSYAQQRNRERIRPDFQLVSSGPLLGDTGAVGALIHVAQCWARTCQGLPLPPTLLTAGSDWLYRSAVLLETSGTEAAPPPLNMTSVVAENRTQTPSSKDSTTS